MTKHYNPSIIERASRILNSKQGDFLSDEVAGPVATIELKPAVRLIASTVASTSSSTNNAQTTPADKDTYITGVALSFVKDVTCDAADGSLRAMVVVGGVTRNLLSFGILTLTAQSGSNSISFPYPIKVDRNSSLGLAQSTFTAGKFVRCVNFFGYTEEVTK